MKKVSYLLLFVIALNLLFAGAVWSKNNQERIMLEFFIGQNTYFVNDIAHDMDAAPVIKEGRTMLPIRFVADALGADVEWNSEERKVTVTLEDTEVELWIEENIALVNGKEQKIDPDNPEVKPLIIPPGRTVLPLRFVSENLGCHVDWSQELQKVTVHYPVNLEPKKNTVLIIEGMEEELTLSLHVSAQSPYAIYVDENSYKVETEDNKDFILPLGEIEPEVFMSIRHKEDVEISKLVDEIEKSLKEKYAGADVHLEGEVEKPVLSYYLYAVGGYAWDDTVERYYLVDDNESGVFIIHQKLFNEAVEGHGTRFNGMLEEFFIWCEEKGRYLPAGSVINNSSDLSSNCWEYQPTDMAPKPGWDSVDLEGLTREELVDVLGCPPHLIRMTSVVSPANNRELWVYHPFEEDPTGLYIWLKGDVFHHSRLDEFNGFWCYEMMDVDFWNN